MYLYYYPILIRINNKEEWKQGISTKNIKKKIYKK